MWCFQWRINGLFLSSVCLVPAHGCGGGTSAFHVPAASALWGSRSAGAWSQRNTCVIRLSATEGRCGTQAQCQAYPRVGALSEHLSSAHCVWRTEQRFTGEQGRSASPSGAAAGAARGPWVRKGPWRRGQPRASRPCASLTVDFQGQPAFPCCFYPSVNPSVHQQRCACASPLFTQMMADSMYCFVSPLFRLWNRS